MNNKEKTEKAIELLEKGLTEAAQAYIYRCDYVILKQAITQVLSLLKKPDSKVKCTATRIGDVCPFLKQPDREMCDDCNGIIEATREEREAYKTQKFLNGCRTFIEKWGEIESNYDDGSGVPVMSQALEIIKQLQITKNTEQPPCETCGGSREVRKSLGGGMTNYVGSKITCPDCSLSAGELIEKLTLDEKEQIQAAIANRDETITKLQAEIQEARRLKDE